MKTLLMALLWISTAALSAPASLGSFQRDCDYRFPAAPEGAVQAKDVKDWAMTHPAENPEQFVASLAQSPKLNDFLQSYVLMHTSRSSQSGSVDPDFPRIIFFKDGLIFAVADHPEYPSDTVEMIQFNFETARFEFHLLQLGKTVEHRSNPGECQSCHGMETRPIWTTYRTWPGAYNHSNNYFTMENPVRASLSPSEVRKLQDEYYDIRDRSELTPSISQRVKEIEGMLYPVTRKRTGAHAHLRPYSQEATAIFTRYLNGLNFRRVAKELSSSKEFGKYRYAAIGALLQCPDIPSFLGNHQGAHEKRLGSTLKEISERTLRDSKEAFQRRLEYATYIEDTEAAREKAFNDQYDVPKISALDYLFSAQGVDVEGFSLNFTPSHDPRGFGFAGLGAGSAGLRESLCFILPPLAREDSEMERFASLSVYGASHEQERKEHCEWLKAKSQAQFQ